MSEAKTKMAPVQTNRLARLLVNFSRETVKAVLQRFDRGTRLRVQSQMDELTALGCKSDEQLLNDFADFLYFEPDQRDASRQPVIRKPNLGGSAGNAELLIFEDILQFNDAALDSLLKASSPDLTIMVLACSPKSFVKRVLSRLSESDADLVQQKMQQHPMIDFSRMQEFHQRYCDIANQLMDQGSISR